MSPEHGGPTIVLTQEDHVALDVFARFAEQEGIGDRIMIEHLPQDCLDPYSPALVDAALLTQ